MDISVLIHHYPKQEENAEGSWIRTDDRASAANARYNTAMHRINDAIVSGGKIVLSDLPFPEGQHVQIIVAEIDKPPVASASIDEVRRLLKGGVQRFDDPFEPAISADTWDMLR